MLLNHVTYSMSLGENIYILNVADELNKIVLPLFKSKCVKSLFR